MNGFWYVWLFESHPSVAVEGDTQYQYVGRIEATSEGWEEMGCDLYPRLDEAGLIPDYNSIEAAEADTDHSICLIYKNSFDGYIIQYAEIDLHDSYAIVYDGEKCQRYMDFHEDDIGKNGWQCCNDQTGCMYNDGHNTCMHPNFVSQSPLANS